MCVRACVCVVVCVCARVHVRVNLCVCVGGCDSTRTKSLGKSGRKLLQMASRPLLPILFQYMSTLRNVLLHVSTCHVASLSLHIHSYVCACVGQRIHACVGQYIHSYVCPSIHVLFAQCAKIVQYMSPCAMSSCSQHQPSSVLCPPFLSLRMHPYICACIYIYV